MARSKINFACPVILASASPRRKELLTGMGIDFTVVPAEVDELVPSDGHSAWETVLRNAEMKAEAVAVLHPEALVIGSDTVVVCGGRIFGKPADRNEAAAMLGTLSGREHQVLTGVALRLKGKALERSFVETSIVRFKVLSEAVIREYMSRVNVMDKAGAYAIQEHGELILERLDGSFSNVIGLPVERLTEELRGLKI